MSLVVTAAGYMKRIAMVVPSESLYCREAALSMAERKKKNVCVRRTTTDGTTIVCCGLHLVGHVETMTSKVSFLKR